MKKVLRLFLIFGFMVVAFMNCGRPGFFGMGHSFSLPESVSSTWNIWGIGEGSAREFQAIGVLRTHCANCHSPPLINGNVKNILDVNYLIAAGWIIPGDPNNSKVYIEIQTNRMPRNNPPLSVNEREIIRSWLAGDPGP